MKRFFALALAAMMLFSFGCSNQTPQPDTDDVAVTIEGSLEEILEKIYANCADVEFPNLGTTEITSENAQYYLGTSDVKFKEAIASEAMINAIAYSVCLVRLEAGEDPEKAVSAIKESANPRKWVCVEAETVEVSNIGDLVILIMADANLASAVSDGFQALTEQ